MGSLSQWKYDFAMEFRARLSLRLSSESIQYYCKASPTTRGFMYDRHLCCMINCIVILFASVKRGQPLCP